MGKLVPAPSRFIFNMADIAVVLLCGIPASGKSTLAEKIQQYVQETRGDTMHVIYVCYDDFIPPDLDVYGSVDSTQLRDSERIVDENGADQGDTCSVDGAVNSSKYSLWKQYRKLVLEAVERVLNLIRSKDQTVRFDACVDVDGLKLEGLPSFQEFWNIFKESISKEGRKCSCFSSSDCRWSGGAHLVLVDDNLYYHSMRYEYVQLARKYGAGYAEVFLDCPLEIAWKRNSLRRHPVSSYTMETMFNKMEPPEPEKFPWEQHSLALKAEEELNIQTMERIAQLVSEALKHPEVLVMEDNSEEKEKSRVACITSIVYQADQVLRKYITKVIAEAKGIGRGKKELQSLASHLNKEKKAFLESLHNVKSEHECSSRIKGTVDPVECCTDDSTKSRGDKTSEDVTSASDSAAKIATKLDLTVNPNQSANVEESKGQDCSADSIGVRRAIASRTHLCLQCFPNVDDKEEFRLFVEELFKEITNSKGHQ